MMDAMINVPMICLTLNGIQKSYGLTYVKQAFKQTKMFRTLTRRFELSRFRTHDLVNVNVQSVPLKLWQPSPIIFILIKYIVCKIKTHFFVCFTSDHHSLQSILAIHLLCGDGLRTKTCQL